MTIKTKVALANTILFGLIVLFFGSFVYRSYRDAEIAKLDSKLVHHAEIFEEEIEEQINEKQFPQFKDFQELSTVGLFNVNFQIIDGAGKILVSNDKNKIMGALPPTNMEGPQQFYFYASGHQRYRILAAPIEIREKNQYLLELAVSMEGIDAGLERLMLLSVFCFPLALITTSFVSYWIVRRSFRPLTDMIKTSQKISVSNLETRLNVPTSHDEVQLLGETLNSMIERIRIAFTIQRQFIADASHEIRTPLTIIYNELEFAKGTTTNLDTLEGIRNSLTEIQRLATLTNGMLTLSRLDALQGHIESKAIETIRLDEVMVECVQALKSQALKNSIGLQIHLDDAVELIVDRETIKSLIFNLLENAIKYSNPGGSVLISLILKVDRPETIQMRVENTGPGILIDDLPHIFNRFFRSASVRQIHPGNGLGLAIVNQIVRLLKGKISVTSEPNHKTIFIVEIPHKQKINSLG